MEGISRTQYFFYYLKKSSTPITLVIKPIQPSLNLDVARNLGSLLRSRRESANLSPQEVADKLLFSKAQVLGLEAGETHFFYGNRLFAQCADKYAAFLGLTERPSATLLATDDVAVVCDPTGAPNIEAELTTPMVQDETIAAPVGTEASVIPPPSKRNIRWLILAFAVAALGIFVVATILWNTAEPKFTELVVSAPPAAAVPSPEPPLSQPQATTDKKEPIPSGCIQLGFSGSSWVQVVETNGTRKDKTYKAGDSLTLEPKKLQALVIGNAKVVMVSSDQGNVSIKGFIAHGSQVARIIGDNVRTLGQ